MCLPKPPSKPKIVPPTPPAKVAELEIGTERKKKKKTGIDALTIPVNKGTSTGGATKSGLSIGGGS